MHRRLGEQLISLPLGWFNSQATGFASGVAVRGTLFVAQTVMDLLVPLIINLTTPLTIACMSFALDWRIGSILLLGAPIIYFAARWGSRRNGPRFPPLSRSAIIKDGVEQFDYTPRFPPLSRSAIIGRS